MQRAQKEEIANGVTHGIGLLLSVAGLVVLVALAALKGSAWHVVSCSVYGATLVLLYAASTLYHSLRSARLKRALKTLDHSAIYLLIAGTYTPFTLVVLRGDWGWTLFAVVWGLSLLGVLFKVRFMDRSKLVSAALYLVIGWLALVALKPLLTHVPLGGVLWLFAGGILYTAGFPFYAWRKLPYSHSVWHVFVLGGSLCHYFAILLYVLPRKA